jgi:hypothetical protein
MSGSWETVYDPRQGPKLPPKPSDVIAEALGSAQFAPTSDSGDWETVARPTHYETPMGPARYVGDGLLEGVDANGAGFLEHISRLPANPVYSKGPHVGYDPARVGVWKASDINDSDLSRRFMVNLNEAAHVNSLGSAVAQRVARGAADAAGYGPEGDAAITKRLQGYEQEFQNLRPWYKADDPLQAITELLTGVGGTVAGAVLDPSSLAGGVGKNVIETFGRGAAANSVADVFTQLLNMDSGVQTEFNPQAEQYDPSTEDFTPTLDAQGRPLPQMQVRGYDPVQTALAGLIGGALPVGVDATFNKEAREQIAALVRAGVDQLRFRRGASSAAPPTPEEIDIVMRDPEIQRILEASGQANSPRADEFADRIAARKAAEGSRPAQTDVSEVSPKAVFDELERQRALKEQGGDGDIDAAFVPPGTPRQVPPAFTVDRAGAARPAQVQGAKARSETDPGLERAVERAGPRMLPAPGRAATNPMTDEAVGIAARQMDLRPEDATARLFQGDRVTEEPSAPGRLVGREEAPPMVAGAIEGQRQAKGAFDLAERQRERLVAGEPPERVRDTQAAGLERGVEPVRVTLDEGNPVKVLRTQVMRDRGGVETEFATVRRYDPRTDEFEPDSIEYQVPVKRLKEGKYTPEPRRAQDFSRRAEGPPAPEKPRMAGPGRPEREPAQTYRATEPDPNEQFPAAGEGRSPLPPQPERTTPPRYSTAEEVMRDFQARQKSQQRSAEFEREARASARYRDAKTSNTPKGTDDAGRWHVDEDGFVLSDKGGPILFAQHEQAAKWIINKGQRKPSDQNFELTNHPTAKAGVSVRETSRTPHPEEFKGKKGLGDEAPRGAAGERSEQSFKKEAGVEEPVRPADETQAPGPSRGEVAEAPTTARADEVSPKARREAPAESESVVTAADLAAEFEKKFGVDADSLTPKELAEAIYRTASMEKREKLMDKFLGSDDTPDMRTFAANTYREATGKQLSPGKTTIREFKEKFREWIDQGAPRPPRDYAAEIAKRRAKEFEDRGFTEADADVAFEFAARLKHAKTEKQFARLLELIPEFQGSEIRAVGKILGVEIPKGMTAGAALLKIKESVNFKNIKERGPMTMFSGPVTPEMLKRLGEILFGGRAEWMRHFAENAKIFSTVAKPGEGLKRLWRGSTSMGRAVFYSADGRARGAAKQLKSKTLEEVADMFHAPAGSSKAVSQTYEEAVQEKVTTAMNDLSEILEPFLADNAALEQITRMVQSGAGDQRSAMGKAAAAVRKALQDELKYLKEAGVEIGNVRSGYFPREFEDMAVMRNPEGFRKAVAKEYRMTGLGAEEANAAADALLDSVLLGGAGAGVFRGGDAGARPAFTAGRVFEKGADARLREFYIQDPVRVLGQYFHRSARRAEAARRFGDKWEKWAKLEHQVREEVGPKDASHAIDDMRALGMVATGMRTHKISPRLVNASAWIRAWTGLSLLEKVSISSLQELVMPGVRSGNLLDQFKGLAKAGSEAAQMIGGGKSRRIEFAEDLGIIYSNLGNNIHVARFFGDDPGSVFLQKATRNFFRNVGLEQLTNATRAIGADTAQVFVRRMALDIGKEWGRLHLRELGIPNEKQASFKKWLEQWDDMMPGAEDLRAKGGKYDENTRMYRTAILRMVNQSVQNPTPATKPTWASHPLGAIVFQLNAFNYAFTKNVLARAHRRGKEALTNTELEAIERAKLAVTTVAPLLLLSAFGVGISVERDRIFRKKREPSSADKEEIFDGGPTRGEFVEGVRHASRIGAFGGADPWVNFFTQAKYDKDPASALTGPAVGAGLNLLSLTPELLWWNSDKTNTTEREAAKYAYDFAIEPAANLMLNTVFPPMLPSALATQALGSGDVREEFVSAVAGKEQKQEKYW